MNKIYIHLVGYLNMSEHQMKTTTIGNFISRELHPTEENDVLDYTGGYTNDIQEPLRLSVDTEQSISQHISVYRFREGKMMYFRRRLHEMIDKRTA